VKKKSGLFRIMSFAVAILLIFNTLLLIAEGVLAAEGDPPVVTSVTIYKVYDKDRNATERRLLIRGSNLKDVEVGIITNTGYYELTNRTTNTPTILQFNMNVDQLGNSIIVGEYEIQLNEGSMPTITAITRKIVLGENDLTIQGTNLDKVFSDSTIFAGYEHEGAYIEFNKSHFENRPSTVVIPSPTGTLGFQDVIFKKVVDGASNPYNPGVTVTIQYTYKEQFTLFGKLEVPGLEMYPNMGKAGDTVTFEAPHPNLDNYDVFFIKATDGTDPYSNANKGKNKSYKSNQNGKDILTVEVPSLQVGEYYVALTNAVPGTQDPSAAVVQELVLSQKFTVIDSEYALTISSIQPDSGPDIGSEATISGKFIISMNVRAFTPDSNEITIERPSTDSNREELIVDYGPGTYNGQPVTNARRKIIVIIGSNATFVEKSSEDAYDVTYSSAVDTIKVRTPQVSDAEEAPQKDVVVETETIFTKSDGSTIVITERKELKKGYTFIPSTLTPKITGVTPEIIQVEPGTSHYYFPNDILIAINGSDFMVTRYDDNGKSIKSYPRVQIGSSIILDKNADPDLNMVVLNESGKEVDGSVNNDRGTKILVTIPRDKFTVDRLGSTYVRVTNPLRNDKGYGFFTQESDIVEFVVVESGKVPYITSVTPSVVPIKGGDTITIEGSNFHTDVRVFLDGNEIKKIERQSDGKTITFQAPEGREGSTQLQVMNPEGGMAIFYPFRYVTTYTDPKIKDFGPKRGNTGTLVTITGSSFMKPDPTANMETLDKLIGTRVFLGNTEVNQYNLNPVTKEIELQPYAAAQGNELLRIESGKLVLADYFRGIVLQDVSNQNHFFTIDRDAKGRIILSDGTGNDYVIGLSADRSSIVADPQGGNIVSLSVERDKITLGTGVTLNIMTLYKIDTATGEIIGNRVKIIDSTLIYFNVPVLYEGDKYYDLIVMNPDTKKDAKTGKDGFYYYSSSHSNPSISRIVPQEGSVDGGYAITIYGRNFEDDGSDKTRVFINGREVDKRNVVVSGDLASIEVIVPPYPGDLAEEKGTNRLAVPVVVLNPSDGATASLEDGFIYVVPSSHPKLTRITPLKGSAAGGEIVEITGSDFRFFEPFDDANRNQVYDPGEEWKDINGNGKHDDLTGITGEPKEDELDKDVRKPVPLADNDLYDYYYSSDILPKVYFGEKQAKIVEYSRGYIKVITPKSSAGTVDVFVVNNDSGLSNSLKYTYEASRPQITDILPSSGARKGGDKVEILGNDFFPSVISIYSSVTGAVYANQSMPLVRFGNITNSNIPRGQENSGRIDNGRTTVKLAGGLTVFYNAVTKDLSVTLEDSGIYTAVFSGYEGDVKFIPTNLLKNSEGTAFKGLELIRVEVVEQRLIVERGYAPHAEYNRSTQIVVTTPYYYASVKVPVTVINPDGGTAVGQFEYKNPSSQPEIINITRDGQAPEPVSGVLVLKVNYKGGSIIEVTGNDFREGAIIQISNLAKIMPVDITYNLPTRLTFEMPAVPQSAVGNMYRLTVLNTDGGAAFSDEAPTPIYILFTEGETSPVILEITPDKGSVKGGNTVTIRGSDFRSSMYGYPDGVLSVYFGNKKVDNTDVTFIDYKTITVVVPAGSPGRVKVRVENPDGEQSKEDVYYTYISSPTVISVVDAKDPGETSLVTSISVEGGEEIKVKGTGFVSGVKVVFNPVVTELNNAENAKGEVIYIGEKMYSLDSGTEGTSVVYIDAETLTVVTPPGALGTKGIIVINPDGGASEVYKNLTYGLPVLNAPGNVEAELVYDRYIKVHWSAVDGAKEYEIYVVEDNETLLVGATKLTSYFHYDLKPQTRYKFIIKAVGNFGPSLPSMESNTVKTGRRAGYPDEDGGLSEKTVITKAGEMAVAEIGKDDFDNAKIIIDLTSGSLAGSKGAVVSMPASVVVSSRAKNIVIIGRDFRIEFNPNAFKSTRMIENSSRGDAGIRMEISVYKGSEDLNGSTAASLSTQYMIKADEYIGKDSLPMEYLAQTIDIIMDFDTDKAQLRRLQNISLNRYEGYELGWNPVGYGDVEDGFISARVNRLGRYIVLGRRR